MWRELPESPIGRIYMEADEEGITGVGTVGDIDETEMKEIKER